MENVEDRTALIGPGPAHASISAFPQGLIVALWACHEFASAAFMLSRLHSLPSWLKIIIGNQNVMPSRPLRKNRGNSREIAIELIKTALPLLHQTSLINAIMKHVAPIIPDEHRMSRKQLCDEV